MKKERVILERNDKGQIVKYEYRINGKTVPDGHKFCPVCSTVKLVSEFTYAGKACAPCARKKAREHHARRMDNPEYKENRKKAGREVYRKFKNQVVEYFHNKCHDCGQSFPHCCYDVHHLDPNEKEFNLSGRKHFTEEVVKELEKCVLLCSNCHRIRHYVEDK